MRELAFVCLSFVALGFAAASASADVRAYCEAYARHQADVRLSGAAIFGAASEPSPEQWEERKTLALADCLTLYTPKSEVETVEAQPTPKAAAEKVSPAPTLLARMSPAQQEKSGGEVANLVPGTKAWEDYCAAKYASFDRATGTYKSYGGKQRPCRVTKS